MSDLLTPDNIGNIVTFLAPGYLATLVYRMVFVKKEPGETALVITSAIYSVPIVILANKLVDLLNKLWPEHPLTLVAKWNNLAYAALLIGLALLLGYGFVALRKLRHVDHFLSKIGFATPEPSIYERLMKFDHRLALCTVTLNDGRVFGGLLSMQQTHEGAATKALYFIRLRWPDPAAANGWGAETTTSMIVPLENIKFIEFGPAGILIHTSSVLNTNILLRSYGRWAYMAIGALLLIYLAMKR